MKVIDYLLNDNLLLIEVEEYGSELVAQVCCLSSTYLITQTIKNPETKQQFTIKLPEHYLGKPAVIIDDIHFDLCPTTLPKNQKR